MDWLRSWFYTTIMKYQPVTVKIKIKYLHHLYFTKLGNIHMMPNYYNLCLTNCTSKLMRDYNKELVSNYIAIVDLELFSVN